MYCRCKVRRVIECFKQGSRSIFERRLPLAITQIQTVGSRSLITPSYIRARKCLYCELCYLPVSVQAPRRLTKLGCLPAVAIISSSFFKSRFSASVAFAVRKKIRFKYKINCHFYVGKMQILYSIFYSSLITQRHHLIAFWTSANPG